MPSWVLGQARPIEIMVMLAIQDAQGERISLSDLAERTGTSRSAVCSAVRQLKARNWLVSRRTQDSDGATGANLYELRIWGSQAGEPVTPPLTAKRWSRGAVPVDLLSSSIAIKGAVFVYLFLQGFQAPSVSTLATLCGMDVKGVRRSLQWLEAEGWIQRIERPGTTSQYRVFFERVGAHRG